MTTPRSPRGYIQKGNHGEGLVKAALERLGLVPLDGKAAESGADLIVLRPDGSLDHLAEVKARAIEPNELEPKPKAALARRAAWSRAKGWAYRLYFIRDREPGRAQIYTVGSLVPALKRKGLSLQLFEAGFLDLPSAKGGARKEAAGAPLPHAESRAVNAGQGEPDTGKTETPLMKQAARPAMPSSMIEHRKVLDVTHVASAVCPFCDRDGPEA